MVGQGGLGLLLLVFVFEACIISVLEVATAAAAPSKIIILIILFICLLWGHLLLIVVVAILDHFIAHYRPIAIDRHTIIISTPCATDLAVGLVVHEALPMNIRWWRIVASLH